MKRLKSILLFQKRILPPALVFSVLIGAIGTSVFAGGLIKSALAAYPFIAALTHYFAYEAANPGEYYFYNNMGLSRAALWGCTLVSGTILLIISITL